MQPDQILGRPAKVLSQARRESYFDQGYLLLESFVSQAWLERLRLVADEFIEESRGLTESKSQARSRTGSPR